MSTTAQERAQVLDRRLAKVARRVRILGSLTWPAHLEADFLEARRTGDRVLPVAPPVEVDLEDVDQALASVEVDADHGDPAGRFLARTATSYRMAVALLDNAGTAAFTRSSVALFGQPSDTVTSDTPTHLQTAEHMLASADLLVPDPAPSLSAEEAAQAVRDAIAPHFDDLPVELDPDMASLAAAGATRIRLRGDTWYTEAQVAQLIQHEALVHSATKRNGLAQPVLSCLGLSSPRTVSTQEGLATLAELVTDALDLARLRRIALRVRALQAALDGADFLEVFDVFIDAGQTEIEAFRSAMRLFRGGDVRGGSVFTKDVVYLQGLATVHTFLLAALREGRPELAQTLFLGRMTLGDTVELEALQRDGTLIAPRTVPPWVSNTSCLAAYLAWSSFQHRIPLATIRIADFANET